MTKSGLIEAVAARMPHLSQRDVEAVVNTLFDAMTRAMGLGDRIEIRGFGSFWVRSLGGRQGRNPKTGKLIDVPPKRVPRFNVGHELRRRVNDGMLRERQAAPEPAADDASPVVAQDSLA